MKRVALGLLVLAMALVPAPSAMATAITGNEAAKGVIDAYTMTGITFANPGLVFSASGSLTAMLNESITLNDFSFASAPNTLLFDFKSGATDITMTILSLTVAENTPSVLLLTGIGTLTETGFSSTTYDFGIRSDLIDGVNVYGFAITQPSATPEPASLLLLGSGLLGLAGLLFRRAKKPNLGLPPEPTQTVKTQFAVR
jgi:hypothetical protein